ncbi:ClC family H(+)/Cl(-) exchange transporter [Prochlorococcus marinus]|uniref:ClC family H(+)/Cl(-) exchange transporter n=1 Tax=Prochlorococcus marinus TaxID=1219 RepID=UPI0001900C8F|nr:ClC family H(+)/Cl(-) exchange transporter [Prochlorococcus marinus]EEE41103.1 chloride channel protein EriC [Prochlorococcus marinus str. MIT 9202]
MPNLVKEKTQENKNNSSRSIKKLLRQRSLVVALSLLLTGLGASITSIFFKTGIYFINNWRLALLDQFPSIAILPVFGAIGGAIAGYLIKNIAPAAKGSGVSQIMGFLRHKKVPMNIKVGLVKLVSGIIAIGSGFPLGPEGPSVQMGGSVAWQMAKWLKAPTAFRRVIVAAGGGAGIAAVFSAPLGGFVYAIEELLNSARPVILLLVVITTFIADSSADIIQALGLDPKAGGFDFNLGFLIQKEYDPSVFFLPIDFIYLVLLGIIIGIFAELYSRYVLLMQNLGKKWYKNKFVLKMSICGLILGSIYSCLPSTFHNLDELQKIIAEQNTSIGIALLAVLVLFITTGLAAASGAPGGLFYPMLTLGGSIGLIMGSWVEIATGHAPSTYIFAGMGAFVAGCSRTPITAMFLAFALTKNLLIMKPVLISCITSFLIARAFNEESIYERQIQIELED